MDVIKDMLSAMRLSGGVVIDAQLRGQFSMISELAPDDWKPYFPVNGSVINYHFVRSGELWAQVGDRPPQKAAQGSILLFPQNSPHRLFNADVPTVLARSVVSPPDSSDPVQVRIPGDGEEVQLYCGFLSAEGFDHPLLELLPSMLVLNLEDSARGDWIGSSMRFASEELHSAPPALIGRVAELLFAEAVRMYVEGLEDSSDWLSGLKDPAVSRAMSIIHSRYGEDLDLDTLAREAGVSRSVLGERFVALLGEPPMRYCARWRMRQAANLLREGRESIANIAFLVGFNSEPAFNRAFKREFGEPPATWKSRLENSEVPFESIAVRA